MSDVKISLRWNPKTQKQDLIITLPTGAASSPPEHEQMHRALVEKLIGTDIKPEDMGEIIVEREDA